MTAKLLDLKQFIADNNLHGLESNIEMLARYQGWLMNFKFFTVPKLHYYCFCILVDSVFSEELGVLSTCLNFGLNLFIEEQGL